MSKKTHVKKLRIKLDIPAEVACLTGIDCAAERFNLAHWIERNTYDDGRHDFAVEMLSDALGRILRGAVAFSVRQFFEAKYGRNTMEKTSESGETNKAYLETEKWMKDDLRWTVVEVEDWKCEVEVVETQEWT